ncbi:BppU family phage baseplate upper protein [Limosilactobacillus reuteri]|uniref:BppU family phage baseplate upper protein n=1 Tax=Limosilactobacillus reuteri TaxID=1598 RepID=UPI001583D552|nr:BppU family phage baseplate upper protein [Limosilactobacillus reuteri]QKT14996.1 BppU family phage baseplate upper protein [Limosilactobacillus reuteri]
MKSIGTDSIGRTIVEEDHRGRYIVLDTLLPDENVTWVNEMSGRQGDAGRIVYFAAMNDGHPRDISGETPKLYAKDAKNVVKVISTVDDVQDEERGLFSMRLPAELYEAAGPYEEAYIAFEQDGMVKSTVNLSFRVYPNGMTITSSQSKPYISEIDQLIADLKQRIDPTRLQLETLEGIAKDLQSNIADDEQLIRSQRVPTLTGDNVFTADQIFNGNLSGSGIEALKNALTDQYLSIDQNSMTALNGFSFGNENVKCTKLTLPSGHSLVNLNLIMETPETFGAEQSAVAVKLPTNFAPQKGFFWLPGIGVITSLNTNEKIIQATLNEDGTIKVFSRSGIISTDANSGGILRLHTTYMI